MISECLRGRITCHTLVNQSPKGISCYRDLRKAIAPRFLSFVIRTIVCQQTDSTTDYQMMHGVPVEAAQPVMSPDNDQFQPEFQQKFIQKLPMF